MPMELRWLEAFLASILGFLIGSFLNVVVHRLPKMLEQQWANECAELSGKTTEPSETFNLVLPRSRCPHCGHAIRWHELAQVISYLFLQGRCSECKAPISLRYPLVEIVTATLFFFCPRHWFRLRDAAGPRPR